MLFRAVVAMLVVGLLAQGEARAWRTDLRGAYTAGGIVNNSASAVAVDHNGDVVAAGALENFPVSLDFTVAKFSGGRGRELWRRELRGTRDTGGNSASGVAVDAAGDIVAVGHLENEDIPGTIAIVKLDGESGAVIWQRELTGDAGWGIGFDVVLDGEGNVLVVGGVTNLGTSDDIAVAKLDGETGAIRWQVAVDGVGAADFGYSVALDPVGNVIVGGVCTRESREFTVLKVRGRDGGEQWRFSIPGEGVASAVAVDRSGLVVAGGTVGSRGFLSAFDGDSGEVRWQHDVGFEPSFIADLAIDAESNVIATGWSNEGGRVVTSVKLQGASGVPIWRSADMSGAAVTVSLDRNGDALVAGGSQGEFFIRKLMGATGAQAWMTTVASAAGGRGGWGFNVASDASGNAVGVGSTENLRSGVSDFTVVKLSTEGGRDLACGDAVLDAGEACDDGNNVDGDGCNTRCQVEGCVQSSPIENGRILLGLRPGRGSDDRLVIRGVLRVDGAAVVAPERTGMQITVDDVGASRRLIELSASTTPVPPGGPGTGCEPRDGWRSSATGVVHTYQNVSGAIDAPRCTPGSAQGVRRVTLLDLRREKRGVRFSLLAEPGGVEHVVGPFRVVVTFDSDHSGPCALHVFPVEDCAVTANGRNVRCHSR